MTTVPLTRAAGASPRRVVAGVTGLKAARSGLVWGVVFGLYVATQSLTYAASYPTLASRQLLVTEFGSNAGISALVGPGFKMDTVPGFTAWKCLMVLAVTGAVWGILTSTRLLRGEEETGRWELLLSGATTRAAAARQALEGLAGGLATLFLVTTVLVIATGRSAKVGISVGDAVFFALTITAGPAIGLALGAVSSQLASTRRQASGYAAGAIGISYALRMVADSGTGLTWLRWVSPIGWIEEMRPLTGPRPLALVPIVALVAAAAAMTVFLAGRRDLGASTLPDHSSGPAHTALLGGAGRLALRQLRPVLFVWALSIVAYGLLLGSIAKSGGKLMTSSPTFEAVFARLGVTGAEAYLGFALLVMAMTTAFVAAGQVGAMRAEESSGRLDQLLARPLSRTDWLVRRVAIAVVAVVVAGGLAGLSTWTGAALEHAGVGFGVMAQAGINTAVPALVLVGVGVLAFGLGPRHTSRAVYAVLTWSLLLELTGALARVNHWILDTSLFHQMAASPSVPVDWTTDAVMVGVGLAAAVAGMVAFTRRDLQGE